ncbi:peptidyl-prolyl cis-trans isomerase CYP95-like, partial [Neltuma alba]
TGGESIYGSKFPDEPKTDNQLGHHERGLLSIETNDRKDGRSHFVITLKPDDNLDRTHVVFGKLIQGLETLAKIERYGPFMPIQIVDCGEYNGNDSDAEDDTGCSSFGRLNEGQLIGDEDEDRRFKSHP